MSDNFKYESRKFGSWGSELPEESAHLSDKSTLSRATKIPSKRKRKILKFFINLKNKISSWVSH